MTLGNETDQEARLAAAGRRAVPPPDAAFADRLDTNLRIAHAGGQTDRRPRARALLAVAAGALVAIVALALVLRPDDQPLTLTTAVATDVVLPDGSVVDGRAGLELPDGSLVRTGAGGSASAGGVVVPGGATALVDDGALVLLRDSGGSTTSTTARAPTTVPPVATSSSTTAPRTGRPTTTTPATRPTTTRPPATSTTQRPTTTTVVATTTTAPPVRLELRVNRNDREVVLDWSAYERADFARYVVVRIQEDRSEVVAERTQPGATNAVDHPPAGRVAYRVVALDAAGRVVGGSPIVGP